MKEAESFAWSGANDTDGEFLRRYAGDPDRINFMLSWHKDDASTAQARERLITLTS